MKFLWLGGAGALAMSAGLGVDNLGGRSYFLFHPFPQRTFIADLKYSF